MAGKALGRQGAGVGSGVADFDQIAYRQFRAGKVLRQHVGGAAQIAHNVHRLRPAFVSVGDDGEGPFRGEQRLVGGGSPTAKLVAQHGRQCRLLQTVHAVLRDHVGLAAGEFFVHHPQPVGSGLRGGEAAGLDHQPGFPRGIVVGSDGVGIRPQSGKVHGLLKGRVIGHAYAAAEVDITHLTVQRRMYPLGQRPAVPVAAAQHVRVQILGLQVHVDALHRHGQVVQQRFQLGQILLINAELTAGSRAAAHTEGGVHPHTDGSPLSFPAAQRTDTRHLA